MTLQPSHNAVLVMCQERWPISTSHITRYSTKFFPRSRRIDLCSVSSFAHDLFSCIWFGLDYKVLILQYRCHFPRHAKVLCKPVLTLPPESRRYFRSYDSTSFLVSDFNIDLCLHAHNFKIRFFHSISILAFPQLWF